MMEKTNAITSKIIKEWDTSLLFSILDNIKDVVMVIDSNTTIVYVNEAYTKKLGVPAEKVLGRRLAEIEPKALAIKVMQTGIPSHNHRDYIASVGIDTIGSAFPLFKGTKMIGSVSIFYNVTEIEELNAELEQAQGFAEYLQEQLNRHEQQLPQSFQEYIGQNRQLQKTLEKAAKVAQTDATVLILGESGVGKNVLARAIHKGSSRADKPLIEVNCAAIPETLLESELFGYEDGAFSGARKGGKIGKFELAHKGTIFLDEIGDMSLNMQSKLLRVLQEKEMERIGGTRTIKLDIRIIAATNQDLGKMVEEGTFRKDLFYRLNLMPLTLLPLRKRKDDIITLTQYFLKKFSQELNCQLTITPRALRILQEYDWPGNIRELKNVLEHAVILRSGDEIDVNLLPAYLRQLDQESPNGEDRPYDLKRRVAELEQELILAALSKNNNNRSKTIKDLGISRRAFYEKLHKYKIEI